MSQSKENIPTRSYVESKAGTSLREVFPTWNEKALPEKEADQIDVDASGTYFSERNTDQRSYLFRDEKDPERGPFTIFISDWPQKDGPEFEAQLATEVENRLGRKPINIVRR